MGACETEIGDLDGQFQTTVWTDILAAGDASNPAQNERLERILRAYWRPVYVYIRGAWHRSVEDAKDLTQEFFTRLIGQHTWSRLRPERGCFRALLLSALKHFLIDAKLHDRRRTPRFSIEADAVELERLGVTTSGEPPERAYDREWFRCLMRDALAELKNQLESEGKAACFGVFETYCLGGADGPTYADLAARLGLKPHDVRNYLSHCRQSLRRLLRLRVREDLATEEEIEREIQRMLR